jgi:hypothetical protein
MYSHYLSLTLREGRNSPYGPEAKNEYQVTEADRSNCGASPSSEPIPTTSCVWRHVPQPAARNSQIFDRGGAERAYPDHVSPTLRQLESTGRAHRRLRKPRDIPRRHGLPISPPWGLCAAPATWATRWRSSRYVRRHFTRSLSSCSREIRARKAEGPADGERLVLRRTSCIWPRCAVKSTCSRLWRAARRSASPLTTIW